MSLLQLWGQSSCYIQLRNYTSSSILELSGSIHLYATKSLLKDTLSLVSLAGDTEGWGAQGCTEGGVHNDTPRGGVRKDALRGGAHKDAQRGVGNSAGTGFLNGTREGSLPAQVWVLPLKHGKDFVRVPPAREGYRLFTREGHCSLFNIFLISL